MRLLGATLPELADFLGVAPSTVSLWKETEPEFSEALQAGAARADARVAARLYDRAIGLKTTETRVDADGNEATTVKELPPDTAAAFIWLKNRRPQDWRDRTEIVNIEAKLDLVEYAKEYARRIGPDAARRFLEDHGYKGRVPELIEGELVETPDSSES
jgi:transcriptional regulator with XRE-family HTH domain